MASGLNNNILQACKHSGQDELCNYSCGEYISSAKPSHRLLVKNLM